MLKSDHKQTGTLSFALNEIKHLPKSHASFLFSSAKFGIKKNIRLYLSLNHCFSVSLGKITDVTQLCSFCCR